MMRYWSISSEVLCDEAKKLWLTTEILISEKNLFKIAGNGKELLFKSTDWGWNTSLGMKIAEDKQITNTLLEMAGIPVAKSLYVNKKQFATFAESDVANLRFPLVIKPHNQAHGNGVMMNIANFTDLEAKMKQSFDTYQIMIVQEQVLWEEYRILVMRDEVIVAINRVPPFVVWDGTSSISTLIEIENANNSLRGNGYEKPLSYIKVDAELDHCIKQYGYSRESIPANNQKVVLRTNSNLGTGASAIDVTPILNQETKEICIRACKEVGLEIAGVDIITNDITKPLYQTGGIILEVNDTPGIGGHRELTSVNSGKRILEKLFFE